MIETTNITNADEDLSRYKNENEVRSFLDRFRLDGLELLPLGGTDGAGLLPRDRILGVHLPIQASWYDFWTGNEEAVLDEFGSLETAAAFYGGSTPDAITDPLKKSLDFAESLHAKYVVFHVSNVTLRETAAYRFTHRDEDVVSAAADIINRVLDENRYHFDFLMENLWWPGLTFTAPEIADSLLSAVRYPRKGFMLDTGHLMHMNLALKTESEAADYVLGVLDSLGSAAGKIKGVHLHESLTGAHVQEMLRDGVPFSGRYWDDFSTVYRHILKIDRHLPFHTRAAAKIVNAIRPAYLTYEFITGSLAEHENFLSLQKKALAD